MRLSFFILSQPQKLQNSRQGARFPNLKIDFSQQQRKENSLISRQFPPKLSSAGSNQRNT